MNKPSTSFNTFKRGVFILKRLFIFIFLLVFILPHFVLSIPVYAISAQSAVVIEAESGCVLYAQSSETQMGMASTTKILTAITALENGDINSVAKVSPTAYGVEGSSMYLCLDEELTLENLLYGLMLVSGNDAATAIAEHISGSTDKFAELMNETALKTGAENSHFTNPHGLSDKNHYTTAHDLAKITAYAMKNPKFREIVSTRKKSIPWKDHDYNRQLVNHNKFLNMYEGCIGVKTGFTKATGRCLVTAVEQNGMTLICVTLNAPDDWNDHTQLYNKCFSEYKLRKIAEQGQAITTVTLDNSSKKSIGLTVAQDACIPVKNDETNIRTKAVLYEDIQAPIQKGDVLGSLEVLTDGTICAEFPLVASEDAEKRIFSFSRQKNSGFIYNCKRVFRAWVTCFY